MRPSMRFRTNKHRGAKKFRRQSARTKIVNMKGPMRGGIRF